MSREENIKKLADSYVTSLRRESFDENPQKWFPEHEDETVRTVKEFHQQLGSIWRDSQDRA